MGQMTPHCGVDLAHGLDTPGLYYLDERISALEG